MKGEYLRSACDTVYRRLSSRLLAKQWITADKRAVSPVIGTILLIAITVLLGATAAAYVFGFGDIASEKETPQVTFDFEYNRVVSGVDTMKIVLEGGETVTAGNLYLTISDASSTSPGDPNGEYDFHSLSGSFGASSEVAAGMSVTADGNLVGGSPSSLDLSAATVSVNWNNHETGNTALLASWTGPDA